MCAFVHQGAEVRFYRNRVSCYSRTSASSLASVILSSQRPFIETFLSVFYILLFPLQNNRLSLIHPLFFCRFLAQLWPSRVSKKS